jgi:hypothetical protein
MTKFKLILILGSAVFTVAGVILVRQAKNELALPLPPTCTPQAVVIALEKQPLPDYYHHTTDYPVVLDFKKMSQAVVP